MRRLAAIVCLCFLGQLSAQDIPLSQIIPPGQGWNQTASYSEDVKTALFNTVKVKGKATAAFVSTSVGKSYFTVEKEPGIFLQSNTGEKKATDCEEVFSALTYASDTGTLYAGSATSLGILAFKVQGDGNLSGQDFYVGVRKFKGVEGAIYSLLIDRTGRIFASTSIGVQVFDPTGRLCGVFTNPEPTQTAKKIVIEKETLYAEVGNKVYQRQILFPKGQK